MKGTFQIESPDKIDATLTVTMTLGEWKQLRERIDSGWPGWQFKDLIFKMIQQGEAKFYQRADQASEAS